MGKQNNVEDCAECGDRTNQVCDVCEDDVCEVCMDDHMEEYHGTGGDEL